MEKNPVIIGCAGFPVNRKKYFQMFKAVETQSSFYRIIKTETLKKMRDEYPESVISIKAPMGITHRYPSPVYRRTNYPDKVEYRRKLGGFYLTEPVKELTKTLLTWIKALRAQAVLFQTPSSFNQNEDNLQAALEYFSYLKEGIKEIPYKVYIVWEPRGWDATTIWETLDRDEVILGGDPEEFGYPPGEVAYIRLHGRVAGKGYGRKYTKEEIKRIIENLYSFQKAFIFFNNFYMWENALMAKRMIENRALRR